MKAENRHKTATAPALPTNQIGSIPIKHDPSPARARSPYCLTYYAAGTRCRKYFPTYKEAADYWTKHKALQKKLGGMAHSATAAADLFLLDRMKRKLPPGAGMDEAIDFYNQHRPQNQAPALGDAIDQFVTVKRDGLHRSKLHIHDVKVRLTVFRHAFGDDRPLLYFNRNNVLDWLLSLEVEPRTMTNYRNALRNFFGHWHGRKCLPVNPVTEITKDQLPKAKGKRKVILSPEQARAFMACVLELCPEYAPYYALQMFCGMRDSQAERIAWEFIDVKRKRITVPAEICKTDDDWLLTDTAPALWDWLALTPGLKGPVTVPSTRQWGNLTAALKGIDPEDGQIVQWPFNGLRRSFCTYDISANDSADKTAAKLQHQSPRRLYKSYLSALRTKEEAAAFFSITPDSVRGLWAIYQAKKVEPFTQIA